MNKKISIIIPVYNVELYISKCLETVINQTYSNLEIILVNDGSTDNSGQLCDQYAENDARIKVIHKCNGGLSSARNAGLSVATGDYIAFVDSDDWLDLTMYSNLINIYESYENVDLVCCGIVEEYFDKTIETSKDTQSVRFYNNNQVFENLLDIQNNIRFEVWNKLFKKETITGLKFIVGQVYEDVYFDFWMFQNVNNLAVLNLSLYHYRIQRPGNTNSTFKWNRFSIFPELYRYIIYFNQNNWGDLKELYAKFAGETAISHYINATTVGANRVLLSECVVWARFFKSLLKQRSLKLDFFCLFPQFYSMIRKTVK